MTKEIVLQIKGMRLEQMGLGEKPEPIEMITTGTYYQKNGKHYIVYEEIAEGFSEKTKNIMKISPKGLEITRRGMTSTSMLFEKNKKKLVTYSTPYGSMLMGIYAHKIEIKESDELIEVLLRYSIELNESPISNSDVKISIQPMKNAGSILEK